MYALAKVDFRNQQMYHYFVISVEFNGSKTKIQIVSSDSSVCVSANITDVMPQTGSVC